MKCSLVLIPVNQKNISILYKKMLQLKQHINQIQLAKSATISERSIAQNLWGNIIVESDCFSIHPS